MCLKSSAVSSLHWLNVTPHPLPGLHEITQVQCRMLQDKYKVRKKQKKTSHKTPPNKRKVQTLYSVVVSFVSNEVLETQSELNSFCWLKAEQDRLNHYHVFKCRVKPGMHPWKIKTGATSAPFQQPLQLEGIVPALVTSLSTGKAPGKLAVKHLN